MAKHKERQEKRQANAEKANGKRTYQCKLPVSETRMELAAAMNITPTEVVPAAKDHMVENIP
jgi:carbohydrate-selective porin OprB